MISLDSDFDPNADKRVITLSENLDESLKDSNSQIGRTEITNLPVKDPNMERSNEQRQSDIFAATKESEVPTQEIVRT